MDALGLSAGAFVLLTFATRDPAMLRRLAIVSNLLFIAYGAIAGMLPILLLHACLLPLNLWHLDKLLGCACCSTSIARHRQELSAREFAWSLQGYRVRSPL